MKVRVLTGCGIAAVGIPLLIFSEYIIFPIAVAILSLIAVFELLRVFGVHKKYFISLPSYLVAAAVPFFTHSMFLERLGGHLSYVLIIAAVMTGYLLYLAISTVLSRGEMDYKSLSSVFTSVFYVTVGFSSLSLLRYIELGGYLFALVFIGAWVCDTFAYFTGRLFGKHKLAPNLSPKKTVEGSIGGIVFTVGGYILYGFLVSRFTDLDPSYLVLALMGLAVSVISQLGDLFASLIKREHGIKDYSKILPGHGGIMDRFDSIIAVSIALLFACTVFSPFS